MLLFNSQVKFGVWHYSGDEEAKVGKRMGFTI